MDLRESRKQPLILLAIAAAASFLFFVSLGARDLWAPNEPTYGRAVVLLIATGVTEAVGVFAARIWPTLAPVAVMVGVCSVFLVAAVWALPAVNPWK